MNRGGLNIDYSQGFQIEQQANESYKSLIQDTLRAERLEFTARSLADKAAGIDAVAQIEGLVYGVSLRYRNGDYNSFTLNRHISEYGSEAGKWLTPFRGNLKPAYHIQIAKAREHIRVIRVNIDAFSDFLRFIDLEKYYNPMLKAYEFKLESLPALSGAVSKVYKV